MTPEARSTPCMENYTGEIVYAAKGAGVECILGDPMCLKYKVSCVARPFCSCPQNLFHVVQTHPPVL